MKKSPCSGHVGRASLIDAAVRIGKVEQTQDAIRSAARNPAIDRPLLVVRLIQALTRSAQPLIESSGDEQERIPQLLRVQAPEVRTPQQAIIRIDARSSAPRRHRPTDKWSIA